MNFISWDAEYRKKIKDMNPGDVFVRDNCLWMMSDSNNGVSKFAIRLTDGKLDSLDKDDEYKMCMGKVTIGIGDRN